MRFLLLLFSLLLLSHSQIEIKIEIPPNFLVDPNSTGLDIHYDDDWLQDLEIESNFSFCGDFLDEEDRDFRDGYLKIFQGGIELKEQEFKIILQQIKDLVDLYSKLNVTQLLESLKNEIEIFNTYKSIVDSRVDGIRDEVNETRKEVSNIEDEIEIWSGITETDDEEISVDAFLEQKRKLVETEQQKLNSSFSALSLEIQIAKQEASRARIEILKILIEMKNNSLESNNETFSEFIEKIKEYQEDLYKAISSHIKSRNLLTFIEDRNVEIQNHILPHLNKTEESLEKIKSGNFCSIEELKKNLLVNSDEYISNIESDFFLFFSQEFTKCNVTPELSPNIRFIINCEQRTDSYIDITQTLKSIISTNLIVPFSNILIEKLKIEKRQNFLGYTVDVIDKIDIDVDVDFENFTSIDLEDLGEITKEIRSRVEGELEEWYNEWLDEQRNKTLVALENKKSQLVQMKADNEKHIKDIEFELTKIYESAKEAHLNDFQEYEIKNISFTFEDDEDENNDENEDDENEEEDENISDIIYRQQEHIINNTIVLHNILKLQHKIAFLEAQNSLFTIQINVLDILLKFHNSPLLSSNLLIIKPIYLLALKKFLIQEIIFNQTEYAFSFWNSELSDQVKDRIDDLKKLKEKNWNDIKEIKESWKSKLPSIKLTIKKIFETISNISITKEDFDDILNDTAGNIELHWELLTPELLNNIKINKIKSVLTKVLQTLAVIPKSSIHVTIDLSQKRSSTYSASAVIDTETTSTPSSSDMQTKQIIGGVIGGVVGLIVILAVVVFFANKKGREDDYRT